MYLYNCKICSQQVFKLTRTEKNWKINLLETIDITLPLNSFLKTSKIKDAQCISWMDQHDGAIHSQRHTKASEAIT